ncbi:MAG: ABC-2 family transporter protein [Bacillota bacterium]|nr:ABC-2 family transporter protein [Bacillota bacterium]
MADNPETGRPGRLRSHLALLRAYLAANMAMAMEYRAAFFGQVFGMLISNGLWLSYWILFFGRFRVVRGWERQDVLMLWAIIAVGYGLAEVLFGAWRRLAALIADGQLDFYLVLPKSPLWHLLMSRSSPAGWGDLVFGVTVFAVWGQPTIARAGLFSLAAIAAGGLLLGVGIVFNALAFFLGHSIGLSSQVEMAMIHFSTYPGAIFGGFTRVLLFTLIPAGFINGMPVSVMREGHVAPLVIALAAAAAWIAAGQLLFALGLRRYESGNLMGPRL